MNRDNECHVMCPTCGQKTDVPPDANGRCFFCVNLELPPESPLERRAREYLRQPARESKRVAH
jgi:hypothetical protein